MPLNLFDPVFYRAANPGAAAFNDDQALQNFQQTGLNQNQAFSPFVDLDYYRTHNPQLEGLSNAELLNHLETSGIKNGLKFSPFLDLDFYLQNNPDVNAAYQGDKVEALIHLQTFGLKEGRNFSIPFDLNYYRQANSFPANFSNEDLFRHFQLFGLNEGRASSEFFNVRYYLENNPDLRSQELNFEQAYQQFVNSGLKEGRNANVKNNVLFNGVAAGDATETSAILWTRTANAATQQGTVSDLVLQVATDPQFQTLHNSFIVQTNPERDYTVKLDNTFLEPNSRYYYRFMAPGGQLSPVGTFKTAPEPDAAVPVRMAFSADTAGEWRPYGLAQNFDDLNLDFFVYLGDTIYETKSGNEQTGVGISPEAADPLTNFSQALADYHRKYLENLKPVNPDGFPGLQNLYAAQGNYTLLDNHELGDKVFANGGAPAGTPPGAGVDPTNPSFDANTTGTFVNKTPGFQDVVLQAYTDYQPVRETVISAPNDPRTDGTHQLYFAQQWGKNAIFINVDDRSYRDIRMRTTTEDNKLVDDKGPRADNPDRTMLGDTQLSWLKETLLQAQQDGVPWKMVALSTPIDINASTSGNKIIPLDTGKTWIGGYRAERNEILKFITENNIENVVFLTADDHELRVNELTYLKDPANPDSERIRVPNAFTVVGGPLAAFGPGLIQDDSFANIKSLADNIVTQQLSKGVDPLGLDPNFPGLQNVFRADHPNANIERLPVDFYSPNTFNYVTLDVSADGQKLSVNAYGMNAYGTNVFPEPNQIDPVSRILGFDVLAQ